MTGQGPLRASLMVATVGLLLLFAAPPARAAELASSDFVIVRTGTVIDDDLYAAAINVRIEGEIRGDLIVVAADRVVIDGTVTGSVTGMAGTVEVNGVVAGSLRVTANHISVTGVVGGDVVAGGVNAVLAGSSEVGGEVIFWGSTMSALGGVEGSVTGQMRSLSLAGRIGGSVVVGVNRLSVVDPLVVGGSLSYRSEREADGLEAAQVGGTVTRRTPLPPNIRVRALAIFLRGMTGLFLTIAAVATIWSWPRRTMAAASHVDLRAWRQWLAGAAVFATPLVLAGGTVLMLALAPPAASLPLLLILVPLMMAVAVSLLVGSLVAGVPVALALGRSVFRNVGAYGATLGGSLILAALWLLPWVGWLVPLVALPLGLGAWMSTRSTPGQLVDSPET